MVGIAAQGVKQLGVARGLVVRHGALHQVAGAVHLVPVAQVLPAHLRLDVDKMRVEVAIRLLGADDLVGHIIDHWLPSSGSGWVISE